MILHFAIYGSVPQLTAYAYTLSSIFFIGYVFLRLRAHTVTTTTPKEDLMIAFVLGVFSLIFTVPVVLIILIFISVVRNGLQ